MGAWGEAVLRDNGYMLRTLAISFTGQTTTPWLHEGAQPQKTVLVYDQACKMLR